MQVRTGVLCLAVFLCLSLVVMMTFFSNSDPTVMGDNSGPLMNGNVTSAVDSESKGSRETESVPSTPSAKPGMTVQVTIKGVKPDAGAIQVAVFGDADGFPDYRQATEKLQVAAVSDVVVATIQLEIPSFALAVYQDTDENGELTKSAFGIPQERYGFSNDARGQFGPPEYSDAMVSASQRKLELEVQLKP